jgi:hypothetical protein
MRVWADEIASRVNCFDLQHWLPQLAQWLDQDVEELLPKDARSEHVLNAYERGISLVFGHPHAGYSDVADISRWILLSAHFQAASQLPFYLDARSETLESVKGKLGNNTVGVSPRLSFFLPDYRVVELALSASGQGIDELKVVRLGRELSWNSVISSRVIA